MAAFRDRTDVGEKLAEALLKYQGDKDAVIYALPRGGVVVGAQVAKILRLPLDLLFVRKIGHPHATEYAICAVSEDGHMVCNEAEMLTVDKNWFQDKTFEEQEVIKRQREIYLGGKLSISPEGKIAILVDDGIATGLTMQAAIKEVKEKHPQKIIVAVPVIPQDTARKLKSEKISTVFGADEIIGLLEPPQEEFLGAVGAYFESFPQVSDEEVVELMNKYGE